MFSEIESRYEGNLHIYAKELSTGKEIVYRQHDKVATASTIKLPILIHIAKLVDEGELDWEMSLNLKEKDIVGGMGVLQHFKTPRALTLHDVCCLMTAVSDNTATNLAIDVTGINAINERIAGWGLKNTRINRKAFSPDNEESRIYGLGFTTAEDMGWILHELYRPTVIKKSVAERVTSMLALQTDLVGIARVLPPDWHYAGKTGRVTEVRGDVGYVKAPDGREWILSIFCYGLKTVNWSIQNDGLLAIAEATQHILGLPKQISNLY
jgi:beta-lactamase class A